MIVLPSRQAYTPDEFVEEFLASLTPALIPRAGFIQWESIDQKLAGLEDGVEFYEDLWARLLGGSDFVSELAGSLLSADNPESLVRCAFELLGHTSPEFATRQDDFRIGELADGIRDGCERLAKQFAEMLADTGFEGVLHREEIADVLMGVQIGLESHRRKNVGGAAFKAEMDRLSNGVLDSLQAEGIDAQLHPELQIEYKGGAKKVDVGITHGGHVRCGIEGNFYTVQGSKPTEIKRSYADVGQRLHSVGVTLVWLTDGKGYRKMRKSLKDAFRTFPNIYNIRMAEKALTSDLASILASR